MQPSESEALYRQLGELAESMPADLRMGFSTPDALKWMGRLHALLKLRIGTGEAIKLEMAWANLSSAALNYSAQGEVRAILYRALAHAELCAPLSARGAFIPAGSAFEAFDALGKILRPATSDVLFVDPYMDERVLTDFAILIPEGVRVALLADEKHVKASLAPAARRWAAQYGGSRPLKLRLTQPRVLHDRLIFVDHETVWHLTQSLNAFASRSPATIVKDDPETTAMKIDAYSGIWSDAAAVDLA